MILWGEFDVHLWILLLFKICFGNFHHFSVVFIIYIRLSARDAHQLYQRLESQGREVVIEMKVKLLKVLTHDYKTAPGAYQFVSMLLEKYARLCQSCHTVAVFLQPLVCTMSAHYYH